MSERMKRKRKIYIASGLDQDGLRTQFGKILKIYDPTDNQEEAEFWILDLDNPPDLYVPFIQDRRQIEGAHIPRSALIPCLIKCAAMPGDQKLKNQIRLSFNGLREHQTEDELLRELQWIESMIPYVKAEAPEVTKEQRDQALALMAKLALGVNP